MTRRTLLSATILAACGRKLATRAAGWLFVASATERGIAVTDLAEFRHMTTIPLNRTPGQLLRVGRQVFVSCPDDRVLTEIDLGNLRAAREIGLPGRIVSAAVVPGSLSMVVATGQPATLCIVDPAARRVVKRVQLPDSPGGLDVAIGMAAVGAAHNDSIVRVSLADGKMAGVTAAGSRCGVLRFRNDGKSILAGLPEAKQIVTLDAVTGVLTARLPVALAPARFCFNSDGGQMFVTGQGGDSIAIVNPYQNEVDQTILAGSTPYGIAVSPTRNLLFVTNGGSGDLTILDIETRRLAASVHVGGSPGEVLLTADEEYALVVNRESGDVAVIRLTTVLDRRIKTKPLFTVFSTGGRPQSAEIVPAEG